LASKSRIDQECAVSLPFYGKNLASLVEAGLFAMEYGHPARANGRQMNDVSKFN
jgi:hypothetical protein